MSYFLVLYLEDGRWSEWIQTTTVKRNKRAFQKEGMPRLYKDRVAAVNAARILLMGDKETEPVDAVRIMQVARPTP